MRYSIYTFLAVCTLTLCGASTAWAAPASLFFSPATGVFPIGEPFSVDVRIDTGGTGVGTADATIVFDFDDLEFMSVSDEGSVMSRILVDSTSIPGRIDISGFTERLKPAYAGTDGLVARIMFMPRRNVATEVRFAQGAATPPLSLGASVGSLANVLTSLRAATYTLVPKEVLPPAEIAGAYTDSGDSFTITPLPVPKEGEWYATTSVTLSFTLPDGVSEMRTGISKNPNAEPDKPYPIPVNSVRLTDLEEGNNYFLLQFKYGETWGSIIRHSVNVDLTPPSYVVVQESERKDAADPRVSFEVEASDTPSGVVKYEVSVDGDEPEMWDGVGAYRPEELDSGEHVLIVTAFDRAGNKKEEELVFLVKSLEPPVLTDAPERVLTGDVITIKGTTYQDADVKIFTSFNDAEATERSVKSDGTGSFVATIADGARTGKYTVWFQVTDERGATSPLSIKRSVEVSQPYIMLFGTVAVTYLSVIIPLLGLIILLVLVLWLGYTFIRGYRARVNRETAEAYDTVNDEFKALRDDLRKQIGMLERANQSRELTREEMRIFTELSKKLDRIEQRIEGEINDIVRMTRDEIPPKEPLEPAHREHAATHVAVSSEIRPQESHHTVRLGRRA